MRVLVANYHARPVGGVETYLRALLPRLVTRTAAVGLLTRESGDPGPRGVPVPGVDWLAGAGDSPAAVLDTAARWTPDVIYTHGLGEPAFERAIAGRWPTVAFMHNYGASCASGSKCYGAPVTTPCDRSLGPACLAIWWTRRCGGRSPLTALRMYGEAADRRAMLHACRGVAVASRHMADDLLRSGLAPARVHHLPLFPTAFTPDSAPPPPRAFSGRLLLAGRVTALKGWRHLLEAVPSAAATLRRPLTLVVAGDGPDREAFERACSAHGVPAEFRGWLLPPDLQAEMRLADLLLLPSLWPEPFGLAGIEAGCVGLPTAAYASGGIPEWLTPGVSGELAPARPPTAAGLAQAIVRALAEPEHWQRLRAGAWHGARRFCPDDHVSRLLSLLEAAGTPT